MIITAAEFDFAAYQSGKWGDHLIIHGDCRDVLPKIPDKAIDLVLTDPPYGWGQNIVAVGNCPAYRDSYEWNDSVPPIEIFDEIFRVATSQIIWGGNYFANLWSNPCRGFLVWDKIQCSDKHADVEMAWTSFDRNAKLFKYCFSGNRYGYENGIRGVGEKSNRVHPTQKPVDLMSWCINQDNEPNLVIDPFLGSGTTLVAAKNLGRRAIGIEINYDYCKIAEQRLAQEVLAL